MAGGPTVDQEFDWNTYIRTIVTTQNDGSTSSWTDDTTQWSRVHTGDVPLEDRGTPPERDLTLRVAPGGSTTTSVITRELRKWTWRAFFESIPANWRIIAAKKGNDAVFSTDPDVGYNNAWDQLGHDLSAVEVFAVEMIMRDASDTTVPEAFLLFVFFCDSRAANVPLCRVYASGTTFDLGSYAADLGSTPAEVVSSADAIVAAAGPKTDYSFMGGGPMYNDFTVARNDTTGLYDAWAYVATDTDGRGFIFGIFTKRVSDFNAVTYCQALSYFGRLQGVEPDAPFGSKAWVVQQDSCNEIDPSNNSDQFLIETSGMFAARTTVTANNDTSEQTHHVIVGPGLDDSENIGGNRAFGGWRTAKVSFMKHTQDNGIGGLFWRDRQCSVLSEMQSPIGLDQVPGMEFSESFQYKPETLTSLPTADVGNTHYADFHDDSDEILTHVAVLTASQTNNTASLTEEHPEDAAVDIAWGGGPRFYWLGYIPDIRIFEHGPNFIIDDSTTSRSVWSHSNRFSNRRPTNFAQNDIPAQFSMLYEATKPQAGDSDKYWISCGQFALPWNEASTFDQGGGPVVVGRVPSRVMRGITSPRLLDPSNGALTTTQADAFSDASHMAFVDASLPENMIFFNDGIVVTFVTASPLASTSAPVEIWVSDTDASVDRTVTIEMMNLLDGGGTPDPEVWITLWDGAAFQERANNGGSGVDTTDPDIDKYTLDPDVTTWGSEYIRFRVTAQDGGQVVTQDYQAVVNLVPAKFIEPHVIHNLVKVAPADGTELHPDQAIVYEASINTSNAIVGMLGLSIAGSSNDELVYRQGHFSGRYQGHSQTFRDTSTFRVTIHRNDGWPRGTNIDDVTLHQLLFTPSYKDPGSGELKSTMCEFSSVDSVLDVNDPLDIHIESTDGVTHFMLGIEEESTGNEYFVAKFIDSPSAVDFSGTFVGLSTAAIGGGSVDVSLRPIRGWPRTESDDVEDIRFYGVGFAESLVP